MPRKATDNTIPQKRIRPGRPKKFRFHGNQRVDKNFLKRDDNNNSQPCTSSKRKLSTDSNISTIENDNIAYEIINFRSVFDSLSEFVRCKDCGKEITFNTVDHVGLAFRIKLQCQNCEPRYIDSCPQISHKNSDSNTRIVYAMRVLGIGFSGIQKFCGLMDLPDFLTRCPYNRIVKCIQTAASEVAELSMMRAAAEEVDLTGDADSIVISGDGSWRKRGFQSLHGLVAIIGNSIGKVLDVNIKSSYCAACKAWEARSGTQEYLDWLDKHGAECTQNHQGTAGKMEVDAMCEIFQRSVEKCNVKYKHYVGDGDSKTFSAVQKMEPYGPDFQMLKEECVGHVQKRMGTRLRNVKKAGKGLGGRGKLTDVLIKELTQYYGNAIRSNNSVEHMHSAIWATYHHKCSTDAVPQHDTCPAGSDSWCTWQKAKESGTLEEYKHKPAVHADVQKAIKPVYDALSKTELLERCVGHFTQNSNESLHSVVWKMAPKEYFSGSETVEIAAYTAVVTFNGGSVRMLDIMSKLGLNMGPRAFARCKEQDRIRLQDADKKALGSTRQARKEKNRRSAANAEADRDLETAFYSAGAF